MEVNFKYSLISGGIAGFCVDTVLFPLDTIKTRLQSAQGFRKAGGFIKIYKGITPVLLTSAPGAAIFFSSYTYTKQLCHQLNLPALPSNVMAASIGETMACILRVPTEVIKQRRMVAQKETPLIICLLTWKNEGIKGFYRGFVSTLLREIPFSILQFPLWEYMKLRWAKKQNKQLLPWQSAVCGCFAGGLSALLTTPIDVAKTRIMLAEKSSEHSKGDVLYTLKHVYKERGFLGLFQGCVPRVLWISIGGAIFLGAYDTSYHHLSQSLNTNLIYNS